MLFCSAVGAAHGSPGCRRLRRFRCSVVSTHQFIVAPAGQLPQTARRGRANPGLQPQCFVASGRSVCDTTRTSFHGMRVWVSGQRISSARPTSMSTCAATKQSSPACFATGGQCLLDRCAEAFWRRRLQNLLLFSASFSGQNFEFRLCPVFVEGTGKYIAIEQRRCKAEREFESSALTASSSRARAVYAVSATLASLDHFPHGTDVPGLVLKAAQRDIRRRSLRRTSKQRR